MLDDSSDEGDDLYAVLGELALRRLDGKLRQDFGMEDPDDLLGITPDQFGVIGLKLARATALLRGSRNEGNNCQTKRPLTVRPLRLLRKRPKQRPPRRQRPRRVVSAKSKLQ